MNITLQQEIKEAVSSYLVRKNGVLVGYVIENGNGGNYPWSVHGVSVDPFNKPHIGDFDTVNNCVVELCGTSKFNYVWRT